MTPGQRAKTEKPKSYAWRLGMTRTTTTVETTTIWATSMKTEKTTHTDSTAFQMTNVKENAENDDNCDDKVVKVDGMDDNSNV